MSSLYANVTGNPSRIKVNFNTLFTPAGNGIDVVVPVKSNRVISERFANTAYGLFFRNPVAYYVVANYVRNTLGKYGLFRSMFSSSTRLFSFQFSSMDRLDAMLKNGPWFIRKSQLILKKWHLDVNLLKEDVGIVLVWVKLHGVPVTVFTEDDFSAIATKFGTPLMLDSYTSDMCMQSWDRSSYARAMIKLRADVELKDNIVVAIPKITGEGYYTCYIRVVYDCEMKNLKKPSQTPKGIKVGQKVGFNPTKHVFQLVSKKPTANSENKKKNVKPNKEVSMSNSFNVLTSVVNDEELGTNEGTLNFASQEANSRGSTVEKLIIDEKVTLLVDEGKPLKKVVFLSDYNSDDEVASIDNEMANFFAKKDGNGQEIPDKIQAIYDNLDIKVRGHKRK
nr:hypothetical protein [Tanacetum cinerariifolium]